MIEVIKVSVAGVAGRMGSTIARLVVDADDMELSGATEMAGHDALGADVGGIIGRAGIDVTVADNTAEAVDDADVLIDFTSPESTIAALEVCAENKVASVIGTTGLNADQHKKLEDSAKGTPVVFAPNMSMGINLLAKLVEQAAKAFGNDYDIEIVEAHHRMKADAPSGTALMLAKTAAAARGLDYDKVAVYGREGKTGARPADQIGVMTLRGGDIVGDHMVMFAGPGERIELIHRAHSRETFARGALRAAKWIAGKEPGLYSMMDVLGLNSGT